MSDGLGSRLSVSELTEAAFGGVLAALRNHDMQPHQFPGPILVGIIAWPELSQFGERAAGGLRREQER
jgi:hypothetical protein